MAVIGGLLVATRAGDDDAPEPATSDEVFLEPAQSVGTDPFFAETELLVDVAVPVFLPTAEPTTGDTPPDQIATQARSGADPGLYGGTRDNSRCNRLQLVEFLEGAPSKATAWAEVQGIDPSQIREFVDTLTPVVLLRDTRVTNHGFREARANPIQSVLQAGTAVLIDDTGLPRVRCACGNPLNRPIAQTRAVYVGPAWGGFRPEAIQVISAGPGSDQFVLQNLDGGEPFARPVAGDGDTDFEATPQAIGAILPGDLMPELGDPARTTPVGGTAPEDAGTDQLDESTTSTTAAPTSVAPTTGPELQVLDSSDYCTAFAQYLSEFEEFETFEGLTEFLRAVISDMSQIAPDAVRSDWEFYRDNFVELNEASSDDDLDVALREREDLADERVEEHYVSVCGGEPFE